MSNRFSPNEIAFMGLDAPVRTEAFVAALEVDGELPDIAGSYLRVGPDPSYPPTYTGYTPVVDGDGMMSMWHLHDGVVDFRSRYVDTERRQLERAANRALFGRYRNPYTDDPSVAGRSRAQANTSMRAHGEVLLAMKEDALPYAIDPTDLSTVGVHDFAGAVTSTTMTAHPKIDSVTGEMVFYGAAARGETTPDIALYTADTSGSVTREEWLVAPYAGMVHDFAVTEHWIVFPIMPCVSDLDRIKAGGTLYDWEPERGMYFGILARHGSASDVRWVPAPTRWMFHVMNAFDDGDLVHIDVAESQVMPFPWFHANPGETWAPDKAVSYLTRWTLNTVTGDFTTNRLNDLTMEFPRIDERYETRPYRHGYFACTDPTKPSIGFGFNPNSLAHFDHATAKVTLAWAGEGATFEEPQFVKRGPSAPEGDGYLLVTRQNHNTRLTDLVIYDTTDISAGPVATAYLPFRVRPGVHGCWLPTA